MGLGNGNPKSGDKGSNHNYEHRNLLAIGQIVAGLVPLGAAATEATLQLVLSAIQNGSEFEARLVEDALNVTWLEVRTWNTVLGTWNPPLYYPPGSNTPGTPTLPVVYINNSSVLSTIASNTTGINLEVTQLLIKGVLDAIVLDTANLDVALSTVSTEATQLLVDANLTLLNTKLNTLGQKASAASAPVVLSTEQEAIIAGITTAITTLGAGALATEATLLLTNGLLTTIDTVLDTIKVDTGDIVTATEGIETLLTGVSKTPSVVTAVADASTTGGVKGLSMWVRGTGGSIGGAPMPDGAKLSWSASDNDDTIGAIAFIVPTGGAGEIIITYLT